MNNKNINLKKRYQVYRRLGYDSYTSRALSQRSLDVSSLEISKKTGKLKRNTITKEYIKVEMNVWKNTKVIDKYENRVSDLVNDTVYSRHGMLTHDKRYRGENGKIISIIRHENKLSTDQAYYFFYFMTKYDMSYKETKKQLLSNQEFEDYDKAKAQRQLAQSSKRKRSKRGK